MTLPPRAHRRARSRSPCPGPFTDDASRRRTISTRSEEAAAMDYAAAVNEEIRDLVRRRRRRRAGRRALHAGAAGEGARSTACRRSTAPWRASSGTTAVHICFGYAAIIHQRPSGYSFLPELAQAARASRCRSRRAQSGLDCAVLTELCRASRSCWAVLDLNDPAVETPETVVRARPARARLTCRRTASILAPDCGMKYLPRDVAFGKDAGHGGGSQAAAGRNTTAAEPAPAIAGDLLTLAEIQDLRRVSGLRGATASCSTRGPRSPVRWPSTPSGPMRSR